jgi:hypothetical protein
MPDNETKRHFLCIEIINEKECMNMGSENVFNFNSIAKRQTVAENEVATELSKLDEFCIWLGVKQMAVPATTTPLEWNSKVLGLLGACFALAMSIGGLIWYASGLAADVRYMQMDMLKQSQRIEKIEEYQRQADLRKEVSRGFEMGVAESGTKKPTK